jgi:hypothetical protein
MKNDNSESKRDKFVRIVESRTNKIIDMIHLLGNCSNQNVYEFSHADVEKIFAAIELELREAKKKYNKIDSKKGSKFTLE